MKKMNNLKTCIAALAVLVGMGSCSDDDKMPETEDKNMVEILSDDADYSMLRTAFVRADLVETLSGSGTFTLFAPDNDAFKAAGFETEASINEVDAATLRDILMYHVLTSRVTASAIPMEMNTPQETAAELDIYVSKNEDGVFVNGAMVKQADIMARNGVIHRIDKVLMPPMGDIVEVARDNDDLSLLVAAIVRASQGSMNVAEALQGEGPFTVFAPTNQAFMSAGFADEGAIMEASPATLTAILTTHVIPSRIYSTALTEGLTATTLAENSLMFSLSNGATVEGPGNTSASKIIGMDMTVDNGVIHVIDQVLLP